MCLEVYYVQGYKHHNKQISTNNIFNQVLVNVVLGGQLKALIKH